MDLDNIQLSIIIVNIISYLVFCWLLFTNYIQTGNLFVIIPMIILGLGLVSNFLINRSFMSFIILFSVIVSVATLFISAKSIKNGKDKNKQQDAYKITIKYLISIIIFSLTGFISHYFFPNSPMFIFIFILLSYTFFTIFDSIRENNLLSLKEIFYGDSKKENNIDIKPFVILILGMWIFFCLISFEGFSTYSNMPFIISLITLFFIIISFIGNILVRNTCKSWNSTNNKNTIQEIYLNIITYTIIILILYLLENIYG